MITDPSGEDRPGRRREPAVEPDHEQHQVSRSGQTAGGGSALIATIVIAVFTVALFVVALLELIFR